MRFAALFDPLPESGQYLIAKQTTYCFAFNHRDAAQEGTRSYVAIGSLSVLVGRTDPLRPVALFRNDGWERAGDPGFEQENRLLKTLPIDPSVLVDAHSEPTLQASDQRIQHKWHGDYSTGQKSWLDRDFWRRAPQAEPDVVSALAAPDPSPDLQFDGKLIRFAFTRKGNSREMPRFCLDGDQRLGTIVRVLNPHLGTPTRTFELIFR